MCASTCLSSPRVSTKTPSANMSISSGVWFLTIFVATIVPAVHVAANTVLPAGMLHDLEKRANISAEKYHKMEESILKSRTRLAQGSPSWFLGASHAILPEAQKLSKKALWSETVATMLVEALNMSSKDAARFLPSMGGARIFCDGDLSISPSPFVQIAEECRKNSVGKADKYRTQTGKCNNPLFPRRGAALEAYARLLPVDYADGVSMPRTKPGGLPSARKVSLTVHAGGPDEQHPYLMAITALFGQFVANDISHTPKVELPDDGGKIKCCDVDYKNFHPECFPIKAESPLICMEYSRSAPHPGSNSGQGCRLGSRQQINQATSFLDLSGLYGSSEATTRALRENRGGRLKTQRQNLPMALTTPGQCRVDSLAFPCFFSGDARVNEHPGLALLHVIFMREHNRIAAQLELLNDHWDDETLFQESRRIAIAELQHITFNEFLPVVLGEAALSRWNLRLKPSGYLTEYDSRVDATLSNAAATAGLAFVTAFTPKTLDLVDTNSPSDARSIKSGERPLLSSFYAPQELYEAGAIDRLITGATAGHSRKPIPPGLNEILLGRYFHDGKSPEAPIDFAAQLIQRGRDHGLPAYVRWRNFCGLNDAKNFDDLDDAIAEDARKKLQAAYENVEDIDLVTGALAETPVDGSVAGPTFACLLGRTFKNLRFGDRYWYENGNTPGAFTREQLEEIRKASMAGILCDNGDRLTRIQPRAFILTDPFLNAMTNCSSYIPGGVDLTAWKEKNR